MDTPVVATVCAADIVEHNGRQYFEVRGDGHDVGVAVTRHKASGDASIWAWSEYYSNGWYALPDADHELLALQRTNTIGDEQWWLIPVEDAVEAAVDVVTQFDSDPYADPDEILEHLDDSVDYGLVFDVACAAEEDDA